MSVKKPVLPHAGEGRVSNNRVRLRQGKHTGTGICGKGSGYSCLSSHQADSLNSCHTFRDAHPSGSPVDLWDPCVHPPREDLFQTPPDVCLAWLSWVVTCQLLKTSGSAVPAACFLLGQLCVSAHLARAPWVLDLLPVFIRGGMDVLESSGTLTLVTDDIHAPPKFVVTIQMQAKTSPPIVICSDTYRNRDLLAQLALCLWRSQLPPPPIPLPSRFPWSLSPSLYPHPHPSCSCSFSSS